MYHKHVWTAIENIARKNKMSCSALARRAGLDPTLFNKSKRFTRDGKPRILSMNSILKLLYSMEMTLSDFETFMFPDGQRPTKTHAEK